MYSENNYNFSTSKLTNPKASETKHKHYYDTE